MSLHFGEALMPTVANGIDMDWNISRARAENLELELRPWGGLAVRLLGYVNHANMGSYDEAIKSFLTGHDPTPDVVAYRRPGRVKTGLGMNTEYTFPRFVRLFARTGWNEGHNESFAYTEVNNSVLGGGDLTGALWNRTQDRLGVAVVSNGLSSPHREYYTAHVWRGLSVSGGLQHIDHPGYNRDRGPILVEMMRLHIDL